MMIGCCSCGCYRSRTHAGFIGEAAASDTETDCIHDRSGDAAEDAAAGVKIPETFKDYLDKWVYGVKDNDELLNVIGGARLAGLKVVPGLGYAGKI